MRSMHFAASLLGVLAAVAIGWPLGCASGSDTSAPPVPPTGGTGGTAVTGGAGQGGAAGGCSTEELCDGLDNDCDDEIDEGCPCIEGDTQDCFPGDPLLIDIGLCAEGVQTCDIDGVWGECEDAVLPVDEVCNGQDDNCDGEDDEGLDGTVTCGLGICQVTVAECEDGVPVPCVAGPPNPTEECDGDDDDCDGQSDNGCDCVEDETDDCYSGSDETRGVGNCHDGTMTCTAAGAWGPCIGDQTPEREDCDDEDNDCDPLTADGSADPAVGVACDGEDSDLCIEGQSTCASGGQLECDDDDNEHDLDLCNGNTNDDCNSATADGSDETWLNGPCDGAGDTDLCADGSYICQSGGQVCQDVGPSLLDLCNGNTNDDCNSATADGADETWLNNPCDGPGDSDLCMDGAFICQAGGQVCQDGGPSLLDLCNGSTHDDCDTSSPDGSEDPAIGVACDSTADSDLCEDGQVVCQGGSPVCNDGLPHRLDLCDGSTTDDCDPASVDGSEDPAIGVACDSALDSDLCADGQVVCQGGSPFCNDTTPHLVDLCNGGTDDDCDPASAEGSEDPSIGVACDGNDDDLCNEATSTCIGGVPNCADANDDDPLCSGGAVYLGSMAGDEGSGLITDTYFDEEWVRVRINEDDDLFDTYLSATVVLTSPAGVDFDLYVWCDGCSTLSGSSSAGGLTGHTDTVEIRNNDDWGDDDDFDLYIHINFFSANACAYWSLAVHGNTAVSTQNCDTS